VYSAACKLVPEFEKGELGRILHMAAPLIRKHFDVVEQTMSGWPMSQERAKLYASTIELHDRLLVRARQAVACWSVVALRIGVVKDLRVMIAKMAWEEVWRWGEKRVPSQ
jgi:hypothetical protein